MTIEEESLQRATSYFQPFPDARSVFGGDYEKHREVILPLATVDLSHLNESWHGPIHIVTPFEPCEGLIGEGFTEYHTYLNRTNWISYELKEGKIEYSGDWRVFSADKYSEYYSAVASGYSKAKDYFSDHGCLRYYTCLLYTSPSPRDRQKSRMPSSA